MARGFGRGRYTSNYRITSRVAVATDAEKAQAKQVIIAKVDHLDQLPILTNLTGGWPHYGEVVAFHLDIGRGGKPKATMFIIPPTAPPHMLKTEIVITTRQPPEEALPVAQFRSLCFYRVINRMLEWLKEYDPEDEKEVLHYMALFEHQVKTAMRKRTLTVTPEIERQWARYSKLRERYLLLREPQEKEHARGITVRLAKTFLTSMNGGSK